MLFLEMAKASSTAAILELVIDLDMWVERRHLIRRQAQVVLAGDLNDRARADCAFEMTVDFRFGQVVIEGSKDFMVVFPGEMDLSVCCLCCGCYAPFAGWRSRPLRPACW